MRITPLEQWMSQRIGSQRLTRGEIESYQVLKLQETVRWARMRSSFYRERLAGLKENDLSSTRDLARFPFTTAEDIRHDPLRFLCVSQSEVQRVVTLQTSGTTGEPKRIYFTDEDRESTIDFFHWGMSTLAGPGDRILILLPGERPGSVGDLLVRGLDRLGAVGVAHGLERNSARFLEVMDRERIDVIVGIPTHVLSLARSGNGNAAPRSVLLSTDYVPEAVSRELNHLWGCEVYSHYGMTEMGFGGGVECQAHFGYHMRELDLYLEIIDPRTGDPVAEGRPGEVVFTTLTRRGMPLIRYRTGDLSRFLSGKCLCGTVLKSLGPVRGRVGGEIELGGGPALSMADLDDALFPVEGLLDFSATLSREGGKDRFTIDAYVKEIHARWIAEAVWEALNAIPGVKHALNTGKVFLSVDIRTADTIPFGGTAKRAIINLGSTSRRSTA